MNNPNPLTISIYDPTAVMLPTLGRGTVRIVSAFMTIRNHGRLVVGWHEPNVAAMFQEFMGGYTYKTGRHYGIDLVPLTHFPPGVRRTAPEMEFGPLYLTVVRAKDDSTLTQTRTTWADYDHAIRNPTWR